MTPSFNGFHVTWKNLTCLHHRCFISTLAPWLLPHCLRWYSYKNQNYGWSRSEQVMVQDQYTCLTLHKLTWLALLVSMAVCVVMRSKIVLCTLNSVLWDGSDVSNGGHCVSKNQMLRFTSSLCLGSARPCNLSFNSKTINTHLTLADVAIGL